LEPLPHERFSIGYREKAKVHVACHVMVDKNCTAFPNRLTGKHVEICYAGLLISDYHKEEAVAWHIRTLKPHQYVTDPGHITH
jgi:hypothetical protein